MFDPQTNRIRKLSSHYKKALNELENIFDSKTNIYIDWANVLGWQDKLGWHIDLKRLKQLCDSFNTIHQVRFYCGTLEGNKKSEKFIKDVKDYGYEVITKPVKIMRLSIDVSSISKNSPFLLENFIRKPLLDKFSLETIEFLNSKLEKLNKDGIKYIEDKKCNFDVEIGRDMLLDYEKNDIENFILWSGDSDFAGPVQQLLDDNKRVFIFATARRVSKELADSKAPIFDIKKIREYICWSRELPQEAIRVLKSQKDS